MNTLLGKTSTLTLRILLTVLIISQTTRGQITQLFGKLDGFYPRGSYEIGSSILVPRGSTAQFEPGTVIRMGKYVELVIQGTLVCEGTPDAPVFLTSEKDGVANNSEEMPQPLDWEGISVRKGGTLRLGFTKLTYASYGIRVEKNSNVDLKEVVFANNSEGPLTVDSETRPIRDGEPITFTIATSSREVGMQSSTITPEEIARSSQRAIRSMRIKRARHITAGSIAAVGGILWVGSYARFRRLEREYQKSDAALAGPRGEAMDRAATSSNVSAIIAGLGTIGLGITFLIQ